MDGSRFDQLTRGLGRGGNRRTFLRGLLGVGGVAAAGSSLRGADTEAARRPTPTPKPVKCPGMQTWNGTRCACPGGSSECGPDCCPNGQAACCDNACCYGQCYGEELCCPTGQTVCNGECCEPGEACVEGICQRCTLCGNQCCGGSTPTCCQDSVGSTCAASEESCCTNDLDCTYLSRCEGDILIQGYCWLGVCQTAPQDCNQGDACYAFSCVDDGEPICLGEPIQGCCTQDSQCQAVDACTPARCLGDQTCNAVSNCESGEQCCNGTCALTTDRCCTSDGDCAGLDFCSDLGSDAYHFTCVESVCTRWTEDCLGGDECIQYGCLNGACTQTPIPNCCADNEACGCTIDDVPFPQCQPGCPTCVAPDGGTLCGCAQVTSTPCNTSSVCRDQYGDAICAGAPGSSVCVVPSQPVA